MCKYLLIILACTVGLAGCASWTSAQKVLVCDGVVDLAKFESARFKDPADAETFEAALTAAGTVCKAVVNGDKVATCDVFGQSAVHCKRLSDPLDVASCQRVIIAAKLVCDLATAEPEEEPVEE